MSIILGIDPGSRTTGYGVITMGDGGTQPSYVASGCIRLPQKDLSTRLGIIFSSIGELIAEFSPEQAAIEQVFVGKNANSALKLGHARGAAMLAISVADIPLAEYAARSVKQAVTGSGAADKIQVQDMIVRLLKLNKSPAEDAADALAIALCHAYSAKLFAKAL